MADGAHILLDPFLSGTLSGILCHPMELSEIHRCDYLLLFHIHVDHAANVGRIQKKFPGLRLFVGDLSADPLCTWQDIDCARLYRVRPGETYEFDNLTIEVFSGRHTESPRGYFRKDLLHPEDPATLSDWFGNLELQNYLLTLCDGTRILVWAGMTSEDQIHRFAGIHPDIALMHVSPKQDFSEFARLSAAIGAKVIIPHHYDFTEALFAAKPELLGHMSAENQRDFVRDGVFDFARYLKALEAACRKECPGTALLPLQHHRWYRFGFCKEEAGDPDQEES